MKTIYLIKAHNFDVAGTVLVATSDRETANSMQGALLKERNTVKKEGRLIFNPKKDRCLARCFSYSHATYLDIKKGHIMYPSYFSIEEVVCDPEN